MTIETAQSQSFLTSKDVARILEGRLLDLLGGDSNNAYSLERERDLSNVDRIPMSVAAEIGMLNAVEIRTQWDLASIDYRGDCDVFVSFDFEGYTGGRLIAMFSGSFHDDYHDENCIYLKTVFNESEWHDWRTKIVEMLSDDEKLAGLISVVMGNGWK